VGLTSLCCCGTNISALAPARILLSYPIEKHRCLRLQHWKSLECYTTKAFRDFFLVKTRQDDSFQDQISGIRARNTHFMSRFDWIILKFHLKSCREEFWITRRQRGQPHEVFSKANDCWSVTTLPKRVLAPRRNVAELPISPLSNIVSSRPSSYPLPLARQALSRTRPRQIL